MCFFLLFSVITKVSFIWISPAASMLNPWLFCKVQEVLSVLGLSLFRYWKRTECFSPTQCFSTHCFRLVVLQKMMNGFHFMAHPDFFFSFNRDKKMLPLEKLWSYYKYVRVWVTHVKNEPGVSYSHCSHTDAHKPHALYDSSPRLWQFIWQKRRSAPRSPLLVRTSPRLTRDAHWDTSTVTEKE